MAEIYAEEVAPIIGAKLLSASRDPDGTAIRFETDRGTLTFSAEGDCCSTSWFESLDDDAAGGEVTAVEESTGPEPDEAAQVGHECLQCYFGVLKTTKGRATWEMRNSSNGYYGGYYRVSWDPS